MPPSQQLIRLIHKTTFLLSVIVHSLSILYTHSQSYIICQKNSIIIILILYRVMCHIMLRVNATILIIIISKKVYYHYFVCANDYCHV